MMKYAKWCNYLYAGRRLSIKLVQLFLYHHKVLIKWKSRQDDGMLQGLMYSIHRKPKCIGFFKSNTNILLICPMINSYRGFYSDLTHDIIFGIDFYRYVFLCWCLLWGTSLVQMRVAVFNLILNLCIATLHSASLSASLAL